MDVGFHEVDFQLFELAFDLYEHVSELGRVAGVAYASAAVAYVCGGEVEVGVDVAVVVPCERVVLRFGCRHGEYPLLMPIVGGVKKNTGLAGCPVALEASALVVSADGAEAVVSPGPGPRSARPPKPTCSGGSWREDCGAVIRLDQ